jgi:hypothetical protein
MEAAKYVLYARRAALLAEEDKVGDEMTMHGKLKRMMEGEGKQKRKKASFIHSFFTGI